MFILKLLKEQKEERKREKRCNSGQVVPQYSPHKRKGLVVPVGCVPAWGGMLIRGWGMDMGAGIPALMPTPPAGPTPIPGITRPIGAIPATGTMVMGCAGREERAMGSATAPKPEGMGLTRIWLRVGGAGWLTWKGLAWAAAAGAEPPVQRQIASKGREGTLLSSRYIMSLFYNAK